MKTFIKRVLASCFLLFIVWCTGLYCFITNIPTQMPPSVDHANAVVVLTGDAGRIELGIDLLMSGKADTLFVSGANQEVTYDDIVRMAPTSKRELVRTITGKKIFLGTNAQNTIGNAQESKAWLEQQGYKHIILVTSHYHMPRSLSEFTHILPGITITPVAVIPRDVRGFFWWLEEKHSHLVMSEYYKYLISKLRHWAIDNVFSEIT